jgi:hypothetical protein
VGLKKQDAEPFMRTEKGTGEASLYLKIKTNVNKNQLDEKPTYLNIGLF